MAQSKSSLSICLTAHRFPILGRATDQGFMWPIAKGLARCGHRVVILSGRSPLAKAEVERDGVKVYYLQESTSALRGLKFEDAVYQKFLELHAENPFSIVHSMDRSAIKIALHRKKLNVLVAYDVAATQMSQLFSILGMVQESIGSLLSNGIAVAYKFLTTYLSTDRELLGTADGMFVTSPQQKIFLERYYLYPDFHSYIVPYGLELGDLSPRPESEELRSKWKLPAHAHIVVTITDMSEPKEVINLLRAFERVAVKKPNTYMIIIGNGPGWKEIEYHLLSLALGSRVIMAGALKAEEISDCISIADVFINMSSRTTGFEPSMIEAMAQKKIIIGSEVSPISNIVEDGVDGFLLRPADTDSIAQLLIELFSGTLTIAEMGNKAREKVTDLFDTQKMVQSLENAYLHMLKFRKTRPRPKLKSDGPSASP